VVRFAFVSQCQQSSGRKVCENFTSKVNNYEEESLRNAMMLKVTSNPRFAQPQSALAAFGEIGRFLAPRTLHPRSHGCRPLILEFISRESYRSSTEQQLCYEMYHFHISTDEYRMDYGASYATWTNISLQHLLSLVRHWRYTSYSKPCLHMTTRCVTMHIRKGVACRPAQTALVIDYVEWGCLKHAAQAQ
jgi:hypothetical protein